MDYLKDVETEEAVEYVLPLLTELAIDEGANHPSSASVLNRKYCADGSVQEALASDLPNTLIWFFSVRIFSFQQELS